MGLFLKLLLKAAPLPDYRKFKRVLFIGPHPDDIEIGAGGTARKLALRGAEVYFLIATDGGAGSLDPEMTSEKLAIIRKAEAEKAGTFLGAKEVEVLSFPDGGDYSVEELTTEIVRRIVKIKPDAVFCPDPLLPTETHPDHLKTGEAARRAIPISQFPLAVKRRGIELPDDCELPQGINLLYYYTARPNIYVPLGKAEQQAKIEAIRLHQSQVDAGFEGVFRYLDFKAKRFGFKAKAKYGEAFYGLGPLHQHCFPEKI